MAWESIDEDFNPVFDYHAVQKKLSDDGDPMKNLLKKRIDVHAALAKFEASYSFLF